MQLSASEAAEYRSLQSRRFGRGQPALTEDESDRLATLTARADDNPTAEVQLVDDTLQNVPVEKADPRTRRIDKRTWVLMMCLPVAVLGGVVFATPHPSELPELRAVATQVDSVPASLLRGANVRVPNDRIRFVGDVEGYRVFIGQTDDDRRACLFALNESTGSALTDCSLVTSAGGPLLAMPTGMTVAVNEPRRGGAQSLSPSVTYGL